MQVKAVKTSARVYLPRPVVGIKAIGLTMLEQVLEPWFK